MTLILSVNFTSCSDDDDEKSEISNLLVGRWVGTNDDYPTYTWLFIFNADGSGTDDGYDMTYTVDGNKLITTDDDGWRDIYTIESIDSGKMILIDEDDNKWTFYKKA